MFNRFHSSLALKLIPFLLVISGCAALIYQVTWVRLLGLSMGSTSAAVSTVLTAFFVGLAIGSYFAKNMMPRHNVSLMPFIWLELITSLCGLLLLPVLLNLDSLMSLLSSTGTLLSVKFLVCLLVLVIPTLCMGATYPILASVVIKRQAEMRVQVGWLYTLNTAGAVLGAGLCGFVLIPTLGLDGAIYAACLLNISAALFGYYLNKQLVFLNMPLVENNHDAELIQTKSEHTESWLLQPLLFFTGFISIACEVGWTKYLSIFTGATIYGFAAILAVFLSGITLGSFASIHYSNNSHTTTKTLAWGLVLLAAGLVLARVGLAQLPFLQELMNAENYPSVAEQTARYLLVFIVLFPATFIFGGLFPIVLSQYCGQITNLQRRVGQGYAINTMGSIIGAVTAGLWLIPAYGTDLLLSVMVVGTALMALFFVSTMTSGKTALMIAVSLLILASWQLPHLNYQELITAKHYRFDKDAVAGKEPKYLFLKEGKAGVISVVTYDNKIARLQNNGIQESYLGLKNEEYPLTEILLGMMPYFLHNDPKSAFIVGFGGGNTVRALTQTPLEQIHVVELEPAVVAGVASILGTDMPLLKDQRVQLKFNDARNSLLVEQQLYDIIVSQPSHPWLSGAGNLFTREFFEIVQSRLNPAGIFAQWVNLFNMDATTLRSILQAYYHVFPHGFVFAKMDSGDLILFGSDQPIRFDYAQIQQRMQTPGIKEPLLRYKLDGPHALLWYFALSRNEALLAAGDMELNTDTNILSEIRLAGMTSEPRGDEDPYALVRRHSSLDLLPYLDSHDVAKTLYLTGQYAYRNFSTTRARNAIARLKEVDPAMAKQLNEQWRLWRKSLR